MVFCSYGHHTFVLEHLENDIKWARGNEILCSDKRSSLVWFGLFLILFSIFG